MREHLVAERETRYLLADRGDDARRFDAECQRRLSADVPFAHANDLVPVADPCGAHRDHQLVRRGRSRRRELEHAHVAAERIDTDGSHPTHNRHLPGILGSTSPGRANPLARTSTWCSRSDRPLIPIRGTEGVSTRRIGLNKPYT